MFSPGPQAYWGAWRISTHHALSWRLARQCKRDDVVTPFGSKAAVAAGGDDEVLTLLLAGAIRHWCRLTARGQTIPPKLPSGIAVKCAHVTIRRRRDEHDVTRSSDRTSHIKSAEIANGSEPRA